MIILNFNGHLLREELDTFASDFLTRHRPPFFSILTDKGGTIQTLMARLFQQKATPHFGRMETNVHHKGFAYAPSGVITGHCVQLVLTTDSL